MSCSSDMGGEEGIETRRIHPPWPLCQVKVPPQWSRVSESALVEFSCSEIGA